MNEALQNPSAGGLVILDGFAGISEWGWDSRQDTILGIPVRAYVNRAMPVIPDRSEIKPTLALTFANGWVLSLIVPSADLQATIGGPSFILATVYAGEGDLVSDPTTLRSVYRDFGDLAVLEATIREVANLPVRNGDELIARYIKINPYRPGIADVILAEYGVSVWALVGAIMLSGATPDEVAQGYGVPREAVVAALAYYQRHRPVIDARIAANNVGVA